MAQPNKMDLKDAIVYLEDATSPDPERIELIMDDGTLQWTENYPREFIKNRGKIDTVRDGDEMEMEISFEGRFYSMTSESGEPITPHEFLRKEGAGSSLVTTGDPCQPYCCDIVVEKKNSCGSVTDEIFRFPKFFVESIGGDFKAGTLSFQGKCNAISPVAIRTAIEE